jgi:NAD-dependent dihydropyrimidine dehydrogenase PreA subunit
MSTENTWQGIPREDIPWYPTVDATTCTGCRECYEFCSHGVYRWDEKNDKTLVSHPYECVVGCSSCAGVCSSGAITFPPLTMLRELKNAYGK